MFDLALRRYLDLRIAAATAALEGSGPAKERLRKALRLLIETELADPDRRGCLATNSVVEFGHADQAVAAQVRGLFDPTESAFRALIEEGQRNGEIHPERARRPWPALASTLLNTITGMRVLTRIEPGPDRLLRVVDATLDLL